VDQNLRSGRRVIVIDCDGLIDAIKGRVCKAAAALHVYTAISTHAGMVGRGVEDVI
jgi:hypothetical protein